MKKFILYFISLTLIPCAWAIQKSHIHPIHPDKVQQVIENHFTKYHAKEYFSAIQVTVKTKDQEKTYVSGKISHAKEAKALTPEHLFNIGSITKSFTASLMLLAEGDNKIELNKKLGEYLDNYPHWSELSLDSLLNMSSGLPNYSDAPKLNYLFSQNLKHFWTKPELLGLVYSSKHNPPLKQGYFYSNTGYILAAMILENQFKTPFATLIKTKLLDKLGLKNTYYPSPAFSSAILKRMAHGYGYNVYTNPELLGVDVKDNNLSWAGAAGGLVANSEDVVRWVEELFIKDSLLNKKQKKVMQTLISTTSGKPIKKTNSIDKKGFGLGVIQAYDKSIGRYWYYQGETLGYRALYMYSPCNKVIISALFNSAVNGQNDHAGLLMQSIYKKVLELNPKLRCRNR